MNKVFAPYRHSLQTRTRACTHARARAHTRTHTCTSACAHTRAHTCTSACVHTRTRTRPFFEDDGGFSTVGMVLALLISVSLVIGATQVYKVRSVAADVQNVADACALAAEKQVASFYIVAQVCDSAILSLSLAGITTIGIGIVAACVPPTQALSAKLVEAGKHILDARTRFARSCAEGLNRLQSLLPIFAALDAAALGRANAGAGGDHSYFALAVLTPFEGQDIALPSTEQEDQALENIEDQRESIAEAAQQAEDAAMQANEHKLAAYRADCGAAPAYCMYERAQTLAGLAGNSNPHYSSVDAWSFSVALRRAQAYYPVRLAQEAPATDAVEEQARSAIRKRFYTYAVSLLNSAYVHETQDTFEAYFPLLPRNTEEMRQTPLYTESVYPITEDAEGARHMHAWSGCPAALEEADAGIGSVAQWEAEGMQTCALCEFSAARVGSVASASTSIENGFEHHYQIVAREAELYEQERSKLDAQTKKVKDPAQDLFETLANLLDGARSFRLKVSPPGSIGAIAVVIDSAGVNMADILPNSLVAAPHSLGSRMAISAASLADDDASETDTVISSLLDGLLQEAGVGVLPAQVLGIWSGLLRMYSAGHESLASHIASCLNSLPLVGASGLGTWASKKFQEYIERVGLEPPDLVSHKPVLLNTFYVASADQSAFNQGLLGAKQVFSHAYGGIAQDPISAVVGIAGGHLLSEYEAWDATFVIAHIELLGEAGAAIPLEITLPPALKDAGTDLIEQALNQLLALSGQAVEVRRWE